HGAASIHRDRTHPHFPAAWLQTLGQSLAGPAVPVRAHLLGVRDDRPWPVRRPQGQLAGPAPHPALPSPAPGRPRPGPARTHWSPGMTTADPSTDTLIVNARLVNEGREFDGDLRIRDGRIAQIGTGLGARPGETVVDAGGRRLLPGMI